MSDFGEVSRLRLELKQALEELSALSTAARNTGESVAALEAPVPAPVATAPIAVTKKLPQVPTMRKLQGANPAMRSSLEEYEFSSPLVSPTKAGNRTSLAQLSSSSGATTPIFGSPAVAQRATWTTAKSNRGSRGIATMSSPNLNAAASTALHPLMLTQEVDISSIAARFYHTCGYDRPNQRLLFHGGLRRDKPSRMCLSQLYALDVSGAADSKAVWQTIETTSASGSAVPSLCWHSNVFLDHTHWMLFGGKSSNNQMSNLAYILDLSTMVWSIVQPQGVAPEARGGHCLHRMPDGDEFVLFGGMDTMGQRCFNDVFVFNRTTRKWRQQLTSNPPVARFVHASAVLGNYLWILGGLKGSLAKSTTCGDLWCLNLETWEWLQPKAMGQMPDAGTYCLFPLDGENGTELLCLGSKAFDDTRSLFYILSVTGDPKQPGTVMWIKGQFSPKLKPSVGEGMSCCVVQKNVFLLGGRPGDEKADYIDLCLIPRDVFSAQVAAERKPLQSSAAAAAAVAAKKGKRLSQSSGAVAGAGAGAANPAVKKGVAATVGARGGKKLQDELRSPSALFKSAEEVTSVRELLVKGESGVFTKEASAVVAAAPISPRPKEKEDLREMLNNLQANFEVELSQRLDAESKFQGLARDYSALKEAYNLLQSEAQRLYQLAMTEVTSVSGREKLERRYDELRSASSEIMVAETPTLGSSNAAITKEKSGFFAAQTGKGVVKKDKMLEYHLHCVEKLNGEVNKLMKPLNTATATAAAATATPAAATLSPSPSVAALPTITSPVQLPRRSSAIISKGGSLAPPEKNAEGRRSGATSPTSIISPRDMLENSDTAELMVMQPTPPETVSELWRSSDLATEFTLFVQHDFPQHVGNVMFCCALQRLLDAHEKTRPALIESIIAEHVLADADSPALALTADLRESMTDDCNGRWVEQPPEDSYWLMLLSLVEAELKPAYAKYAAALKSPESRRQHHMSLKRRPDGSGHHQLVATAEEQLRERLAEMGKDSDQASAASDSGEATDEFLFKKVTSELISTEINYVTDLKVTTTIFRRPLTEEKSAILPLEVFNIFANIEDVYALNRKFLTVLQKEHGKPLGSKNYGKVFLEFAAQFQKVYLTYAGRKTVSRNTLDRLSATNKKFLSFLEECLQKAPCRRLELKSFLIKPVQRICKYPLLLRTMVDSAPKGYPDRASLVEAKKKMEEVVFALEDQLFVEDDKMKVLELEGALNWHREPKLTLAVEGRNMIYDSVLIVSEMQVGANADEAMMKNMRNIHLYLLNDVMLMVEQVEKKGVRRDFLYHVVGVAYSVVVPVPGKAAFQILQPQRDFKYLFRCASTEQKLTWVRVLTDAISAARTKTAGDAKAGLTGSGTPATAASAAAMTATTTTTTATTTAAQDQSGEAVE